MCKCVNLSKCVLLIWAQPCVESQHLRPTVIYGLSLVWLRVWKVCEKSIHCSFLILQTEIDPGKSLFRDEPTCLLCMINLLICVYACMCWIQGINNNLKISKAKMCYFKEKKSKWFMCEEFHLEWEQTRSFHIFPMPSVVYCLCFPDSL